MICGANVAQNATRSFGFSCSWIYMPVWISGNRGNAACKILMRGSVSYLRRRYIPVKGARSARVHREMHQKGRFFQANKSSSRMKASFSHSLACTAKRRRHRVARFTRREISRETRAQQSEIREMRARKMAAYYLAGRTLRRSAGPTPVPFVNANAYACNSMRMWCLS